VTKGPAALKTLLMLSVCSFARITAFSHPNNAIDNADEKLEIAGVFAHFAEMLII
jgi:hypothetical protein